MKDSFFGFYPPTQSELNVLWKEGLIVLDTNVLLNLYRLPTAARDELFLVLDAFKNRLWIPHQVALEFQRRRLSVIASERKSTEGALTTAKSAFAELRTKVEELQIEKRGLGVDCRPILDNLEAANNRLVEAIEEVHKAQLEISSEDSIRDRLDVLLAGKIGNGPSTQQDLDALSTDGEKRFDEKIPPGFLDADKDKNPNEASFVYDHLRYQRKFGDLILWRQVLARVNEVKAKAVLLVTGDKKEDWWWREHGKTIGPQPELSREMRRVGGAKLFWMYTPDQFLQRASTYSAATVSSRSVEELRSVVEAQNEWKHMPWAQMTEKFELSAREREILRQTATGQTSDEIAKALGISSRSVNFAITEVLEKLDAKNKTEAVAKAIRLGLLDDAYGPRSGTNDIFRFSEGEQILLAVRDWLYANFGPVRNNSNGFPDFLLGNENIGGFEVVNVSKLANALKSSAFTRTLIQGNNAVSTGQIADLTVIVVHPEIEFHRGFPDDLSFALRAQAEETLESLSVSYPLRVILGTIDSGGFDEEKRFGFTPRR